MSRRAQLSLAVSRTACQLPAQASRSPPIEMVGHRSPRAILSHPTTDNYLTRQVKRTTPPLPGWTGATISHRSTSDSFSLRCRAEIGSYARLIGPWHKFQTRGEVVDKRHVLHRLVANIIEAEREMDGFTRLRKWGGSHLDHPQLWTARRLADREDGFRLLVANQGVGRSAAEHHLHRLLFLPGNCRGRASREPSHLALFVRPGAKNRDVLKRQEAVLEAFGSDGRREAPSPWRLR